MIIRLLLFTTSCNDNSSDSSSSRMVDFPSQPVDGDQVNFAAIFNYPPHQ